MKRERRGKGGAGDCESGKERDLFAKCLALGSRGEAMERLEDKKIKKKTRTC